MDVLAFLWEVVHRLISQINKLWGLSSMHLNLCGSFFFEDVFRCISYFSCSLGLKRLKTSLWDVLLSILRLPFKVIVRLLWLLKATFLFSLNAIVCVWELLSNDVLNFKLAVVHTWQRRVDMLVSNNLGDLLLTNLTFFILNYHTLVLWKRRFSFHRKLTILL